MMRTVLKTAPTAEPVTLTEAKLHLRLAVDSEEAETYTRENALLTRLITLARKRVEFLTARALMTQTWYGYLDEFPAEDYILVPKPPLQSATVKYKIKIGTESTFTYFDTDVKSHWGRLVLKPDYSWPTDALYPTNPITVEFVCGYAAAASVPECAKQAMLIMVSDMYESRGAPGPGGTSEIVSRAMDALLDEISVRRFGSCI